jgi:hypothetical protein
MNIIEEQNMNGENNPDVTANMDAPSHAPSAKKVYSKPMLVVLSQNDVRNSKQARITPESPAPFSLSWGPS